ncbi:MAG: sigma 54-interacting transcriptional regulator [Thermoanaerobaculia bacterium]
MTTRVPCHPALADLPGQPPEAAVLSDHDRLAVLLEAAAVLSLLGAAGWHLPRGLAPARIDGEKRLRGLAASPGVERRFAQVELRGLLLRLFRGERTIAGRGPARRAARELLALWEPAIAPLAPDLAVAQIRGAAPFLITASESAESRLRGELQDPRGLRHEWRPGRGEATTPCAYEPPRELARAGRFHAAVLAWRSAPPEDPEETLEFAHALVGDGRFEPALLLLGSRRDVATETLRAECQLLLGDLGAARETVRRLERRDLAAGELLAAGDIALRILANSGEPAAAARWVERAREAAGEAGVGALAARLLAATAAFDRDDRATLDAEIAAAAAAESVPELAERWLEVQVWQAQAHSDGDRQERYAVEHLARFRRGMRRHEAGRAWTSLGLGRATRGDLAGAERAFRHAERALAACDGPLVRTLAAVNLADMRLRQGKLAGIEPILDASRAHNRRAGNRRGAAVDAAIQARLELARGRPERGLAIADGALAELDRHAVDWFRAELELVAARALGRLGRGGEAAQRLAAVTPEALGYFEAEERPAVYALAGLETQALRQAEATGWRDLWVAALDGRAPDPEAWEPSRALGAYRRARLVLDIAMVAAGAVPAALRREAASVLRGLDDERDALALEIEDGRAWRALRAFCERPPGDLEAARTLLDGLGHPEAALVYRGAAGERELLAGEGPCGAEIARPLDAEGALLLRAASLDDPLRAAFSLLVREPLPLPREAREADSGGAGLVGESPALAAALARLGRLAASEVPILLLGESGTGKELAAREAHRRSARQRGPWVPVNCAALSETLILSELFGHARGAFTGADRDRAGLFEAARGGTLFLDEIGDLPPAAQGNLLRVLQESEIRRLGETHARRVDVRVIAATHRDLVAEVAAGRFRQDLYYRLRVGIVTLPPLRERGDDVLLLAEHVLARERARRPGLRLSAAARRALAAHDWPGNVRELANALVAAAHLAPGPLIEPDHLDLPDRREAAEGATGTYHERVECFRRELVRRALDESGGRQAAAARKLGLSRQALSYLVRQLGVH